MLIHNGPAHAASRASGHLHKRMLPAAAHHIFQHPHAIFHAIHGEIGIVWVVAVHTLEDTPAGGECPSPAFLPYCFALLHLYPGLCKPGGKILKGKHTVHQAGQIIRFRLF
ncbi:hypothetical protein SDC9_147248 [bioreactor metagenome]|uniref:Uncharacterized protein n=1 Tax=bioreactor metagenome TaxID=1076179 RepID=A0A645EH21_9ZZZZ